MKRFLVVFVALVLLGAVVSCNKASKLKSTSAELRIESQELAIMVVRMEIFHCSNELRKAWNYMKLYNLEMSAEMRMPILKTLAHMNNSENYLEQARGLCLTLKRKARNRDKIKEWEFTEIKMAIENSRLEIEKARTKIDELKALMDYKIDTTGNL